MSQTPKQAPKHAGAGETFAMVVFWAVGLSLFWILPVPSTKSIMIYTSYFLFQFFAMAIIPGKFVQGLPLENGKSLTYNCNGLIIYVLTIVLFFVGGYLNIWKYTVIYDNYFELISVTNWASWIGWLIIFIKGRLSSERVPYDGIVKEIWLGAGKNRILII